METPQDPFPGPDVPPEGVEEAAACSLDSSPEAVLAVGPRYIESARQDMEADPVSDEERLQARIDDQTRRLAAAAHITDVGLVTALRDSIRHDVYRDWHQFEINRVRISH